MKTLETTQIYLGKTKIPSPDFGDIKLNVFPVNHENIVLPKQFSDYLEVVKEMLSYVPVQKGATTHFVTIDSKFFVKEEYLRREGVHIDGNLCADPNFKGKTWGGTSTTWGGLKCTPELKIIQEFETEHKVPIEIGTYVSDSLGGIICASNLEGCKVWKGDFKGHVGEEGDFSEMKDQLTPDREFILGKDEMWFMTSNTPHETLLIPKGSRRTFLRITLAHDYQNALITCSSKLKTA